MFFCRKLCFSSVGSTTVAGNVVLAERLTADDELEVGTTEGVGVLLTVEPGKEVGRIGEVNLVSDLGTDRGSCLTIGAGAAPPDLLEEGTKDLAWLTVTFQAGSDGLGARVLIASLKASMTTVCCSSRCCLRMSTFSLATCLE